MFNRLSLLSACAALLLAGTAAEAVTLRYANQGDLKSLDPYTLNETTTNSHLGHVYEGLTKRGKDLSIEPGLAERWETSEDGLTWRFYLRKNVKFHNGNPFTADDVVFSANRVRAQGSNFQTRVPTNAEFVKVDDYTVDVKLKTPNPIMNYQWDTWYIMDKEWAEANNAAAPTPASAQTPSFAALNTNGTGPFKIESHQPGVKTVFKKNDAWWGKVEHNLDEIVFTPIGSDATRVAALLSGEVDVIEPVPIQDIQRVDTSPNAQVLKGPELRTIFLGFDQTRDELLFSNVKGKNPFKDIKVRQAFYKAIDIETIKTRVMRGLSTPSPLMIAPELVTFFKDFERPKYDPDGAKKLLAEAGYPNGFEVGMDCPNDRYVNDEAICQAAVEHARPGRREGEPDGAAEGAVLRQGPEGRQLPDLLLPARLDARHLRRPQRPERHPGLPRQPAILARRVQSRRLLQQEARRARRQGARRERQDEARRRHEGGLQDRLRRLRLHPAASAGSRLGRVEEGLADATRRQRRAALLGAQGVGAARAHGTVAGPVPATAFRSGP